MNNTNETKATNDQPDAVLTDDDLDNVAGGCPTTRVIIDGKLVYKVGPNRTPSGSGLPSNWS